MNDSLKDKGLVSIIMPSYNTERYISDSIKSVQAQTYSNWEMIIVDDCSTDKTDEVILNFLYDSRVKYVKNEKNLGAALTRNRALKEAKGKWIAFLDSDDLWEPTKLERQIKFMQENSYIFSYTEYEEIDEHGITLGINVSGPKRVTQRMMELYCWPGCLTVMYSSEDIDLLQIKDIKKNNDYAMWLEVCKRADCWLLEESLAKYRKRAGSVSRHNVWTMIGWHYRLWNEIQERPAIIAAFYTLMNLIFGFVKRKKYKTHSSKR